MAQNIGASFHQLPRKQLLWTIFGLQITLLLAAMDQTIVATAMPRIIGDLNGFDRYAWVTTSYLLTSTAILPMFGRLSDMYGRKWLLLFGAVGFVVSSALCGMSGEFPSQWLGDGMMQLVIFRGLQGIFGGAIMSLVFTVVGDLFSPADRGKYQGLFSAVFALASVVGPALGGWITDNLSWRWVFYVNAPIGALAVVVLWFFFPHINFERHKHRLDVLGVVFVIGWVVPLLLALTWGPVQGLLAPAVVWMVIFAVVFLLLFIYHEARTPEPIVPLSMIADPVIGLSCISLLFVGVGMFGAILFVPLYFQAVEGVSATQAGSFLTPMMLMITLGSVVCGQVASRVGRYKWAGLVGPSILATGLFLFSGVKQNTSHVAAISYMLIIGGGLGLLMPLYTLAVQNAVPLRVIGVATALIQFFRSIGGTLGAAIFNSILMFRYHNYLHQFMPADISPRTAAAFQNPLKLEQLSVPAGGSSSPMPHVTSHIQNDLMIVVKHALLYALDSIFFVAGILMVVLAVVNIFLKESPLRHGPANVNAAPGDEEVIVPQPPEGP